MLSAPLCPVSTPGNCLQFSLTRLLRSSLYLPVSNVVSWPLVGFYDKQGSFCKRNHHWMLDLSQHNLLGKKGRIVKIICSTPDSFSLWVDYRNCHLQYMISLWVEGLRTGNTSTLIKQPLWTLNSTELYILISFLNFSFFFFFSFCILDRQGFTAFIGWLSASLKHNDINLIWKVKKYMIFWFMQQNGA